MGENLKRNEKETFYCFLVSIPHLLAPFIFLLKFDKKMSQRIGNKIKHADCGGKIQMRNAKCLSVLIVIKLNLLCCILN